MTSLFIFLVNSYKLNAHIVPTPGNRYEYVPHILTIYHLYPFQFLALIFEVLAQVLYAFPWLIFSLSDDDTLDRKAVARESHMCRNFRSHNFRRPGFPCTAE